MAEIAFNTNEGQTITRGLLILYLNTGTSEVPVWSPMGKRVEDSSMEYDWQRESKKDILDNTYTTMKKPIITQSFDPWDLAGGDTAQKKIWDMGIRDQDAQALCTLDMMVAHLYAGTATTAVFAERYDGCSVEPTGLGGEGGGNVGMPVTVTFGGNRTVGTAAITESGVTFTKGV